MKYLDLIIVQSINDRKKIDPDYILYHGMREP